MANEKWPTEPVHLNHLEAMGIAMALMGEEQRDGLSEPQRSALDKVHVVIGNHMRSMGRPG